MKPGDTFPLYDPLGRTIYQATVIRLITLHGVSGFALHKFTHGTGEDFRISHIETGSLVTYGRTDGEAFVRAREWSHLRLTESINKTRRHLSHIREQQGIKEKESV